MLSWFVCAVCVRQQHLQEADHTRYRDAARKCIANHMIMRDRSDHLPLFFLIVCRSSGRGDVEELQFDRFGVAPEDVWRSVTQLAALLFAVTPLVRVGELAADRLCSCRFSIYGS